MTEHISNLLQRDRDISQQKASKEILWYDGSTRFLSTYTSTKVIEDDKIARSWMSQYAYEELWTKVVISSRKYVKTNLNDGYVSIHKIGTGLEEGIKIKVGNRCPCTKRVAFQYQCVHEYMMDGSLDLTKYSSELWMSNYQYIVHCQRTGLTSSRTRMSCPTNQTNTNNTRAVVNQSTIESSSHTVEQSTNNDIDMDTQQDYNNMMMGSTVIRDQCSLPTYCSILDQGKEIARCVQNDSLGLQAVACAFDQILETLRNSKSVSTLDFSDTIGLLHKSMYEKRGARSDDIAVPAITKQNTSSAS